MPSEGNIDIMTFVDAMLSQIVTVTGLNAQMVYTVPDENEAPKLRKNVQIITVALTSFLPDVGQQTGGAAYNATYNQTWRTVFPVRVWSNYMVDQVGQNDKWLRDASRGILPLFMKVFKALEQFFPTNNGQPVSAGGIPMLEQPMRLSPGGFTFVPDAMTSMPCIRSEWEASFIPLLPT